MSSSPQPHDKLAVEGSPRGGSFGSSFSRQLEMVAKKREKDNEFHLMSQIQELSRQLEAERTRIKLESGGEAGGRLIVVANRLPVTPVKNANGEWELKRSSGGLVSAFLGVRDFSITWVGWVGVEVPPEERQQLTTLLAAQQPFRCCPVYLDEEIADGYYNGFSNNVLWPLLHYIPLSMLDSHGDAAERQWSCYQAANAAFCDAVMSISPTELDTVWVQDYHLMLLPQYLRDASPSLSIGWFLHTPFVIADMYLTLPHREEILRGVLGADLCGFHIYEYAQHFTSACGQVLGIGGNTGVTQGPDGLFDHASRRSVAIDTFPIGIDPAPFERALDSSAVKDKIIDLQRRFDGKKVLLGIDRLDYVKGIPHKLKALEYFLGNYPAWRGKVVLVQIAVPSRTEVAGYQKLRANVHRLVSRINGTFGTLEYVPIHYLDQSMKFPELCALYYRADSMVVTSLRDGMNLVSFESPTNEEVISQHPSHSSSGMNLVSFEYLACQTSKNAKGVLVLSEFAGAAQALGAGALLVNPYNVAEVARAIDESLNMPASEREERFEYLDKHIHGHTAQEWAEQYVGSLRHARQTSSYDAGPFSELSLAATLPVQQVVASYKACERSAGQRLLIFGLLGTLIDYESFASLQPPPQWVRRNLAALAASPHNTLVVLSGRERALLNEWLGDLPIWLVAENGLWIRPPPGWESGGGGGGGAAASGSAASLPASTWEMVAEGVDDSWMASLKPIFKYFEARTPETLTEVQEHTITWHYCDAADEFADVQAVALQSHLVKVSGNAPVEVGLDMKRVEVRPYGVSKGAAISRILEQLSARWRLEQRIESEERLARLTEEPAERLSRRSGSLSPDEDPFGRPPRAHEPASGRHAASSTSPRCGGGTGGATSSSTSPLAARAADASGAGVAAAASPAVGPSRGAAASDLRPIPAAVRSLPAAGLPLLLTPDPCASPFNERSPPGSGGGTPSLRPQPATSPSLEASRESSSGGCGGGAPSTITGSTSRGGDEGFGPPATRSHFEWVLCVSEVMARDEDLFTALKDYCGHGGEKASPMADPTPPNPPPTREASIVISRASSLHPAGGASLSAAATAAAGAGCGSRSSSVSYELGGRAEPPEPPRPPLGQLLRERASLPNLASLQGHVSDHAPLRHSVDQPAGAVSWGSGLRLDALLAMSHAESERPQTALFTCCVGKELSQAEYHLNPDGTAGLLDLLANASFDAPSTLDSTPSKPQHPSVLERLPHLLRGLVGKQLLFLLDYDGCEAALAALAGEELPAAAAAAAATAASAAASPTGPAPPSAAAVAIASLSARYPVVVVRRSVTGAEAEPSAVAEPNPRGDISGVQIFPFSPAPAMPQVPAVSSWDGWGSVRGSGSWGGLAAGCRDGPATEARRWRPPIATSAAAAAAQAPAFAAPPPPLRPLPAEMIEHEYAYRPSLESCASKLSEKLQGAGLMAAEPSATSGVSLSDSNHFSLSVLLRGASEAEDASTRGLVLETVEKEFPMLRCVEERTSLEIRPKPQWNRAKAVKWLTDTVVDRVAGTLGVKAVVPVYVGDDTAFGASICELEGGVYVHITGGPSSHDGSYFLREASQADELLRFFVEQAHAGVTVRGGKLRQAERHADESARRRGLPAWIGSAPAPAAPAMGGSRPPQWHRAASSDRVPR